MKRLAVLVSGQGRNLQALIEACADGRIPASIGIVISNKPGVGGLERAQRAGITTAVIAHGSYASREDFDAALSAEIDSHGADYVILAGFMRVLTAGFVRRYSGRLLNIHPSLLPRHPGLQTHQKVIEAGDATHGATVHYVTEALDGGPPIIQGEFMVQPQDTPASLAERVMSEVELKVYPQAVAWLVRGLLGLEGGHVRYRGQPLTEVLQLKDVEKEFLKP